MEFIKRINPLVPLILLILNMGAVVVGQQTTYLDSGQSADKRVADLLEKMTLEEKVGQINMPCVYQDAFGTDIPAKSVGVKKFVLGTLVDIGPGGGFFTLANEILRDGTKQQT